MRAEGTYLLKNFRIDNYLNYNLESPPFNYCGFSLRYYTTNILKVKITKYKEKDFLNLKNDIVIITTLNQKSDESSDKSSDKRSDEISDEISDERSDEISYLKPIHSYMDEIKKTCTERNIICENIYKPQTCLDFNDYFLNYRMLLLVIIKLDTKKNVS